MKLLRAAVGVPLVVLAIVLGFAAAPLCWLSEALVAAGQWLMRLGGRALGQTVAVVPPADPPPVRVPAAEAMGSTPELRIARIQTLREILDRQERQEMTAVIPRGPVQ